MVILMLMVEHVSELSHKYLVLKHEDIKKYLNSNDKRELERMLSVIAHGRENDERPRSNEYVVLNMDDEFKVSVFYKEMTKVIAERPRKVKDCAVALVNTILYSKK